ncbi:MAG: hypothetical protein IJL29_02830 [Prevotella sp.]|nr:hypothetical protein [Prevotella sp.]MBQ6658148.1 hypothetical protein [Prevotella sp.]
MRTQIKSILLFAVFCMSVVSCSKDEEESVSPYTTEQLATLKVLHGSFSNTPDLMTGNIKTTFVFNETYMDKPRTISTTNHYGEKSDIIIHGYLTYSNDYSDGSRYENQGAFYLHINGTDLTLYHINSDKTISLNSSPKKYKVIIVDNNQIRLIDMDFPYSSGQYYNRNF